MRVFSVHGRRDVSIAAAAVVFVILLMVPLPAPAGTSDGVVDISSLEVAAATATMSIAPSNVAIFQDQNPWGSTAITDILTANSIPFTIFDSTAIGAADLSPFDKVVISSQQPLSFYSTVSANAAWFEAYAGGGGILEFHGGSYYGDDWSGLAMPFGVTIMPQSDTYATGAVTVVTPGHPLVTDPHIIDDTIMDGWNATAHSYFTGVGLPFWVSPVVDDNSGQSIMFEAVAGAGCFLATMVNLEFGAVYFTPAPLENMLLRTCQAGPATEYFLVDSGVLAVKVVKGANIVRTFPTRDLQMPIAVSSSVRTYGENGGGSVNFGSEYGLDGTWTGVDYPWQGVATGYLADGTTDGATANWLVAFNESNIYRYDRDWTNPVLLGSVGGAPVGLTRDSTNGHFFVFSYDNQAVEEYTSIGIPVGSFPMGGGSDWFGALAYEPATDTLWIYNAQNGGIGQFTKNGVFLQAVYPAGLTGYIWGGEFNIVGGTSDMYATDDALNNFYGLDPATGATTLIGSTVEDLSFSGMAYDSTNDVMYVSDVTMTGGWGLGWVDIATGAVTQIGLHVNSNDIMGLAYNPATDTLYGADGDNAGLATVNRTTGESTLLGAWGGATEYIRGLAYNQNAGVLYAVGVTTLYSVNQGTGAATVIGAHGLALGGFFALEFNPVTATMYIGGESVTDLHSIDTATAATTAIGPTGLTALSGMGTVASSGPSTGTLNGQLSFVPDLMGTDPSGFLIEAVPSGGGAPIITTTDGTGHWTMDVPTEVYDVTAGATMWLSAQYVGAVVTAGMTTTLPNPTMIGGDFAATFEDIGVVDVAYVASRYGTGDLSADLNRSGAVDLVDVTSTASNYGTTGPTTW